MKQIISRWLLPFTCVWLLLASACSKDSTETPSTDPVPPTLTTEGLSDDGLHFLYSAQTPQTFTLTVNAPWEISKTAGWFVATPRSGKAGEQIVITILPDFNEGNARTGEFTIRANSGNNLKPCITEKTVKLAQDAYMSAGIVVIGLDEPQVFDAKSPKSISFQANATYNWTLVVENGPWVSVSPQNGPAETETTVTITPTDNATGSQRSANLIITATDPNNPDNTATEEFTLVQAPYFEADTHTEGHVFFNEDFAWITQNWVSPYSKYGWPSVSVDGKNNNEFALSTSGIKEIIDEKGYLYTASNYARYEGHIKLGKTSQMGSITTPAISGIDEGKSATLLVQFDGALYSSAGGTIDSGDNRFYVSVEPPATIGGLVEQQGSVEMSNVWSWTRYSVLVYNATSETRITLGSENTVTCRLYLDNITVTRAKDAGAVAPAPIAVDTPLDKELINTTPKELFNKDKKFINTGGTFSGSIRINRAWTAESDCDWLTITAVKCGATGTGVNNGAALANGVATVTATSLPYNNTQIEVARNTGEERSGNILIKVDGQVVDQISITQEKGNPIWFQFENLTDNTLELPYTAGSELKFKVTASHAWTLTTDASTWYMVSPASGDANTQVEVTVKAIEANSGIRRFAAFVLKAGTGTGTLEETITLSQATAGVGSVKWDLSAPIQWLLSADNMKKYTPDFAGLASDKAKTNALPAEQGPGYISYAHTYAGGHTKCERIVGATGEPYITGAWPGDYWTFLVPVASLPAGTKINFKGSPQTSATGQKYWKMEYKDGSEWKPATALKTAKVEGTDISYTHEMTSSAVNIDLTMTFAQAITNGNIEIRFTCMANDQVNGKGPLSEPGGGTFRFKGSAASPKIQVVP